MAVAAETSRGVDQAMDGLLGFKARLYKALEIEPDSPNISIQTLFPQELFESPENMLTKSIELAEKVSKAWQPPESNHHFRPDDDSMVHGLLDFGVYAVQTLAEAMPNVGAENVENIEEGILQVITRIRGAVETSDKRGNVRKRNLRTDRDDLRIRFTEELNRSSEISS